MSNTNITQQDYLLNKLYTLLAGGIKLSLTNYSILSSQAINTTFSQILIEGTSSSYTFSIFSDPSTKFVLLNDAGGATGFKRNLQINASISAGTYLLGITTTDAVGRTNNSYHKIIVS